MLSLNSIFPMSRDGVAIRRLSTMKVFGRCEMRRPSAPNISRAIELLTDGLVWTLGDEPFKFSVDGPVAAEVPALSAASAILLSHARNKHSHQWTNEWGDCSRIESSSL